MAIAISRNFVGFALLGILTLAACEGPPGPRGAQGPQGPPGEGIDAAPAPDGTRDSSQDTFEGGQGDAPTDTADSAASDLGGDTERLDPRRVCQSCHPGLDVSLLNLVGIHDPASRRYNGNCLHCHQDVLLRTTLDAGIREIHPRMLPFAGTWRGAPRNEDCRFCHPRVDLSGERSAAGLRRQVEPSVCVGCHRDGAWDYYLP
ncbi:MAG: hypothetical protein HY909_02545 [Deltaproteobacteria bacterium]|nr:hypothetical protein [Deltaproteobacteria bacterium]